jgi:hypothetical protein
MSRALAPELTLAMAVALERSECDLVEVLVRVRASCGDIETELLLESALRRLEMMRIALGRRDDGDMPS